VCRLSEITLHLERLESRQIAGVYTLNAALDGAFAATCLAACAITIIAYRSYSPAGT